MADDPVKYYRYEDRRYANGPSEYDEEYTGSHQEVHLREFELDKITKHGVWVRLGFSNRRFIKNSSTKKFACPTKELALESFIARKTRQASIHQQVVDDAKNAIELAKRMEDKRYIRPGYRGW